MALKGVLIDFGNTLVSTRLDWSRIVPASLIDLCRALKVHLPGLDFDRLGRDFLFMRRADKQRANRELIEVPAEESLARALGLQGVHHPGEQVLTEAIDAYFTAEERAYPLIFGVPEALAAMREMGLKLALVSNATCGRLVRKALARRGQLARFDHLAISAEMGPRKPDPALFLAGMHALGLQPSGCVVVGDLLDRDIEGARRAGMRAVLADFLGMHPSVPEGGPRPDAIVQQPDELIALLRSWLDA